MKSQASKRKSGNTTIPRASLKSLLRRHKSVNEVTAACREWADATAGRLAALMTPELSGGETLPDLALLQELIGRALERRFRAASEADEGRLRVTLRYRDLLVQRNLAARALYRALGDLRTLLRGLRGKGADESSLGFGGDTSRDPVVLLRQADRAVARLRHRPEPLLAAGAAAVSAAAEQLRSASRRVRQTAAELDGAVLDRQHALDAFNDAFVGIAGWFEATYRLTGRADQAE